MGTGGSLLGGGVNHPGHEAEHSPPYSAEVTVSTVTCLHGADKDSYILKLLQNFHSHPGGCLHYLSIHPFTE